MCRTTQIVIFEKPKGNKGAKVMSVVLWPSGFSILPNDGGLEEQSYITMRLFQAFLSGERSGVSRMISKRA